MWIVSLALRRPYAVAVLSLLILLLGGLSAQRMRRDIFPAIDIPVVQVVWSYNGLGAEDMERRVVLLSERAYSNTVNGITRIESEALNGIGLIKIYFEPGTEIGAAIAQIGSVSQTAMRQMPPGMTAPVVIQFNASSVTVAQLTLKGETQSEQALFDYGMNFLRLRLFTVPGLATPAPYGGRSRQVMIDVDPAACAARKISAQDVLNVLLSENLIFPAGTTRIGEKEYEVTINNSPADIASFARIPVRVVEGATVYLGDVARVRDGFAVQNNVVRVDGRRASYLAILKKADASTLAVVDSVRELLPLIRATAPEGVEIDLDFDQSRFVRAAIGGVLHEGWMSSLLVSLMVLAFLGSWRSVLIVCTSIPLAICVALIGLFVSGDTLNIMTLGGLSLAIGMLVDDATVEVENVHRNRHLGLPLTRAILAGAEQIATPALAATLTICIVFFPVVMLTGPARYLFVPLAKSVVIAMLASYLLSRTLVPVLARMLLAKETLSLHDRAPRTFGERADVVREASLGWLQRRYAVLLDQVLSRRAFVGCVLLVLAANGVVLARLVGTDFFPEVDAGQMRLHVRAPAGTRIEETEQIVAAVEEEIRSIVPKGEIKSIVDNIGMPTSFNLAFVQTDNVAGHDADILISLQPEHAPTIEYRRRIRRALTEKFVGLHAYFQPADIVSQVLNFGMSSAIDVEVEGVNLDTSAQIARSLRDRIDTIPGVVDLRIHQQLARPALHLDVDRGRALQLGLTQDNIARALLTSLSSSALVAPSYWLNPQNGVNYLVAVQTPLRLSSDIHQLLSTPLSGTALPPEVLGLNPVGQAPYLGGVARLRIADTFASVSHDAVQRVVNLQCGVEGRDLGAVAADIQAAIDGLPPLPKGSAVHLRGQPESMRTSFASLGGGLVLAVVLVYLLMATLFQSWLDPVIIMMAVPGALVGVMAMLALTHTTVNVESLMGTIMAVGVAVSNSILLVSFANEVRADGLDARAAALLAGETRLRPVLMTALAMVLGMLPMALGLGEGGEQNAPLGRAVIGGLLVATCMTLFGVPLIYALLRRRPPTLHRRDADFAAELDEPSSTPGAHP